MTVTEWSGYTAPVNVEKHNESFGMKKRLNLMFALFVALNASLTAAGGVSSVIPCPAKTETKPGAFEVTSDTPIHYSEGAEAKARQLADALNIPTGYQLKAVHGEAVGGAVFLTLDRALASLGEEGYQLSVATEGVILSAPTEAGLFHGAQTLRQLLPAEAFSSKAVPEVKWEIPCVEINDQPKYPWRGLMIDISRHFFGLDTLKDMVDWMAMHKLNRLHIHLTDSPGWRLEIKGYPKLTTIAAQGNRSNKNGPVQFLMQEEIKELVAYANSRHIVVVPEIDIPGHFAAAARAYPELDGGAETLKVTAPEVDAFLEAVFTQVGALFNSPYIHFGSDEVRRHNWDAQPDMVKVRNELGLKNQHELEGWFDRKVADFIVEKGYTPMAWDDAAGFGINKQSILQWWRCRHPEALTQALKNDYKVVISPADHIYFDYAYDLLGLPFGPSLSRTRRGWSI